MFYHSDSHAEHCAVFECNWSVKYSLFTANDLTFINTTDRENNYILSH